MDEQSNFQLEGDIVLDEQLNDDFSNRCNPGRTCFWGGNDHLQSQGEQIFICLLPFCQLMCVNLFVCLLLPIDVFQFVCLFTFAN